MVKLVVWGNNVAGNLSPDPEEDVYIKEPTVIERGPGEEVESVIWASWTCTILTLSGKHEILGRTGLQSDVDLLKLLDEDIGAKVIGDDQPRAILHLDGSLDALDTTVEPRLTEGRFKDVAMTGLGSVYTISNAIIRYDSLANLMAGETGSEITHPAFDLSQNLSLHATESRVLMLSKGALSHLFELKTDQHGQTSVLLVDDLEGLGVASVISGSCNRFGVITEGGDAYIVNKGSVEVEPVELEDDSAVRFVGVGSKFEVIVTEHNVWVRGNNGFSQLGIPDPKSGDESAKAKGKEEDDEDDEFIRHPYFDNPSRIKAILCARWSTILEMHDNP